MADRNRPHTFDLMAAIVESSDDAILSKTLDGTITSWNAAAERMYGYAPAEMIGTSVSRLVPSGRRDEMPAILARVGRGERIDRFITERVRKDGRPVEVRLTISPIRDSDGNVVGASTIASEALPGRIAEGTTLRMLVASSPLPTVFLDPDGTVRLWNPAAERLFGVLSEEVVGGQLPGVPHAEATLARQIVNAAVRDEPIGRLELTPQHADGRELRVELSVAPWRDGAGGIVGIVGQFADVTARRQLEEQLLQAQKMESIGRLAGSVAHDFSNLITAISGFSQLLLLDLSADDPRRANVESIKLAATQASALTSQLLSFSRRQALEPRVFSPNDVLRSIEPMLRRLVTERTDVEMRLNPKAGNIRADSMQLAQVVLNLVANARDAMPSGGRLTIETDRTYFGEAYASEHFEVSPGHYVMLVVSDTGMGMDQATRAHVFEPFFTTKERGKGTGLGLATIYGIVRESEGHIWLYSEPSEGTTVKVYFPLVTDRADDRVPAPAAAPRGAETLLLVEDEDAVRELARIVLERQGYTVLVAADGKAALRTAAGYHGGIDLLITDVVMPELGGPVLAERLRDLRPELAVLFLSGYTEEVVARDGRLQAGHAFLAKPFTPDALCRKVREVLERRAVATR